MFRRGSIMRSAISMECEDDGTMIRISSQLVSTCDLLAQKLLVYRETFSSNLYREKNAQECLRGGGKRGSAPSRA